MGRGTKVPNYACAIMILRGLTVATTERPFAFYKLGYASKVTSVQPTTTVFLKRCCHITVFQALPNILIF
jgi:hypothetical protein